MIPGQKFTYNDIEFVVIDISTFNPFVITTSPAFHSIFDPTSTNYFDSCLKSKVDEWVARNNIPAVRREIDTLPLTGRLYSQTRFVEAAPLTYDEARKYHSKIEPYIEEETFLATSWDGPNESSIVTLRPSGTLDSSDRSIKLAIYPALYFGKSQLYDLKHYSTDKLLIELKTRLKEN